jgi:hypothetical protein
VQVLNLLENRLDEKRLDPDLVVYGNQSQSRKQIDMAPKLFTTG